MNAYVGLKLLCSLCMFLHIHAFEEIINEEKPSVILEDKETVSLKENILSDQETASKEQEALSISTEKLALGEQEKIPQKTLLDDISEEKVQEENITLEKLDEKEQSFFTSDDNESDDSEKEASVSVEQTVESTDSQSNISEKDNMSIVEEEELQEKEDVVAKEESLELSEPLGIDTVSLQEPQGNWLFKRVWWERAEEHYEKINQLVQKMMEIRINFFAKRADIDKKILDPFYLEAGMNHTELLVTLEKLIKEIEKERDADGMLSFEKRELLEILEIDKDAVLQLQKDVLAIQEIDHSVDSALEKLIEIMNEMRQHERNAWVYFKEIARVLSEKKARELFYNIDASWQHIKTLRDYLEKEFSPYFAKLSLSVKDHIEMVQKEITFLKKKGVDLKESVTLLTKNESLIVYEDEEDDDEHELQHISWFTWIGNIFWAIITFPYTIIKKIVGVFF